MTRTNGHHALHALDQKPWMQTASGRAFPLVDPEPSDVHWPDVAYHLAHVNRFGGAVGCYSVAQHSVWPLAEMPFDWRPYWLLHDAHEFAVGDIITPVQTAMRYLQGRRRGLLGTTIAHESVAALKAGVDRAIYGAAGLVWPVPEDIAEAIHVVDARMIATERRDLHAPAPRPWGYEHVAPYSQPLVPWSPDMSYQMFAAALTKHFGLTLPAMSDIRKNVEQEI